MATGGRFDVVALAQPPSAAALALMATLLDDDGVLVARWGATREEQRLALEPHGLALAEPVDDSGTGVMRARKADRGPGVRPVLTVRTIVYAALLMDIRTRLPARGLRSDPDLRLSYATPPSDFPNLPRDAPKVVVLQRPAELAMGFWLPLMARCIRDGWVAVIEFDDYPPLIAEVLGRPNQPGNMTRFGFFHAVQTSTPPLVELIRPHNPETALFPNAVFELLPYSAKPRPRRVCYGAVLRGRYGVEVARALAPALAEHPDAEVVVIGDRDVFNALPTGAKRYYEYMSYEAYLDLMSQCSISLAPLEALPMRETKSDAKFLDASRAGVLTIASPTVYDRVIEPGVNGLLAPKVEDWAPLLARALSDEPWREAMARRAWEYVRGERMFANQVDLRREWYLDLWRRRDQLNEALMDRMPGLREAVAR